MRLYDFAAHILLPPLLKLWRFEAHGRQNVPLTGPLIVAANHASYMDPIALGVACPRPISYMAKADLFRIPILGALIERVYAYPVERGVKASTTGAIKKSVQILGEGRAIGIFPQGTRVREGEGKSKAGVALLASLAKAPVVPAYIWGSKDAVRLHQIKVVFGKPMTLPAGRKATRDEIANFTRDVMAAIRGLEQNIHGN
ncbi:MAG: 1-acyl-sn-glycerol-3-phosphate acyltransferase [Candidatus Eremiobacteraeota bacterium]|nr:1-acyl-sn-glycerol-3-phosphate acyltransferase [Candidatus Eremiobacteraeota bacterium]